MSRTQFLAFCALGFGGCFLGGFVGQVGSTKAMAQNQGYTGPVRIRTEDNLVIPDGGLRLVNSQNRVLGAIIEQNGSGGIVFLDSQGKPSVSMIGGSGGQIDITAQAAPVLRMNSSGAKEGIAVTTTDSNASIKLREGLTLISGTDGGHVTLSDSKANVSLRLENSAAGGNIVGFDQAKSPLFELSVKEGEGVINLSAKGAEAGFQAKGSGASLIRKDKETIWKMPADESSR